MVEKLEKLTARVFILHIRCPVIARNARAGQFVMIRFQDRTDPLLGRPFAVAGSEGEIFRVWFQVTGKMTTLLSALSGGEIMSVRGPLGNGFGKPGREKLVLVAGTLGVAPLLKAYEEFGRKMDCELHLGVPDSSWFPFTEKVRDLITDVRLFSDDGSLGSQGNCLKGLSPIPGSDEEIWACGPVPMLKALAGHYRKGMPSIRVSLEARMACGIGGCQGCVIETVKGKKRVCVDGPVFSAQEVTWDGMD